MKSFIYVVPEDRYGDFIYVHVCHILKSFIYVVPGDIYEGLVCRTVYMCIYVIYQVHHIYVYVIYMKSPIYVVPGDIYGGLIRRTWMQDCIHVHICHMYESPSCIHVCHIYEVLHVYMYVMYMKSFIYTCMSYICSRSYMWFRETYMKYMKDFIYV